MSSIPIKTHTILATNLSESSLERDAIWVLNKLKICFKYALKTVQGKNKSKTCCHLQPINYVQFYYTSLQTSILLI